MSEGFKSSRQPMMNRLSSFENNYRRFCRFVDVRRRRQASFVTKDELKNFP